MFGKKEGYGKVNFYADNGNVYSFEQKDAFIIDAYMSGYNTVWGHKGEDFYEVLNIPCAFDIEVTKYEIDGHKTGFMYIWMFGINGICIYGRTWKQFKKLMKDIKDTWGLNFYRRLICYVHNLSYEFQFMRKHFKWIGIFASDDRKPMYALTNMGIEFRCSYFLTGVRLENVGEELTKYKCEKKVGDLDYDLIRHDETPITETELGYCINDIRVVMCKIQECIEKEGKITNIPLTKTGYVRRDVRNAANKNKKVMKVIHNLNITKEEYEMLHDAFQGGFTHANALHSGQPKYDVTSYDFTSSYPAVMISEMFPMGNGKKIDVETLTNQKFEEYLKDKCCLMRVTMTNVRLKDGMGDAPISSSKCHVLEGDRKTRTLLVDNGRVRKAEMLSTTITEQDFNIYRNFYDFEYAVNKLIVYNKAYLPKPFIEKVLEYYIGKTVLKDVVGREEEYMFLKSNLNSIFGMMVMDVVREVIEYYGDTWTKKDPDIDDVIEKYNESKNRFTWYPWGVWITAYARKNLFTAIYECDEDYIYSDTDSVKIMNADLHKEYIENYNKLITKKLEKCLDFYDLDKVMLSPKTKEGKRKPLGVWDFDGHYKCFKTLGAKRYMILMDEEWEEKENKRLYEEWLKTEEDKRPKECPKANPLKTTIAGVPKKSGAEFFSKFDDPFKEFEDGKVIPAEETGKLTHYYCDEAVHGIMTDYLGNTKEVESLSGIYLEKAPFKIGISSEYTSLLEYLGMAKEENYR